MTAKRQKRYRCPDCAATSVIDGVSTLRHRSPCRSGDAIDEVGDLDRRWFAEHPAAPWRWRPLQLAEYAELSTAGADPTAGRWRALVQPHPHGLQRAMCRDGRAVLVVVDVAHARRAA